MNTDFRKLFDGEIIGAEKLGDVAEARLINSDAKVRIPTPEQCNAFFEKAKASPAFVVKSEEELKAQKKESDRLWASAWEQAEGTKDV